MSWFWVFIKECKSFLRDKVSLITYLVVPMILIGILGMALSNAFVSGSSSQVELEPITLFIENKDEGPLGEQLFLTMLSEELSTWFIISDQSEGAFLHVTIPNDFSNKVWLGQQINFVLKAEDRSRILVSMLEQVVEQFIREAQMLTFLQGKVDFNSITVAGEISLPLVVEKSVAGSEQEPLSSFQYYAVGMGVMYLLFLGIGATKAFMEERRQMTLLRLKVTPQSIVKILFGKFLGWTALGVLQFGVLVTGTRWIYGVHWGTSYTQLFVVILGYAFAIAAIGFLLATFFEKEETTDQIGSISVMVMAAVGGSMAPMFLFPEIVNTLAKILPNAWALQTILSIIEGVSWKSVWLALTTLMSMGFVSLSIGAIRVNQQLKG